MLLCLLLRFYYLRRFNFGWWGRYFTTSFSRWRWLYDLQFCSTNCLRLFLIGWNVSSRRWWRRYILSHTLKFWWFAIRLCFGNSITLEGHILFIPINWLFQDRWSIHRRRWRSHPSSLFWNVLLLLLMMFLSLLEWWRWWFYWSVHRRRNSILLLGNWWLWNSILLNMWWRWISSTFIHSRRRFF